MSLHNFFHLSPSPAESQTIPEKEVPEGTIDLNEQLIRNKASTFFMRVNSDAMANAGIGSGDVVIVDRALEPKNGKIVIARVGGQLLLRKLEITQGKKRLVPATDRLASLDFDPATAQIWGVITYVIRSF